jgi:hypothetical protein
MVQNYNEPVTTPEGVILTQTAIGNYWGFCNVPDDSRATWGLYRATVCFVCASVAIAATRHRAMGRSMALAWVVLCATIVECLIEPLNYAAYRLTAPPRILSLFDVWAPQSTAYNILIDTGGAMCGIVLAAVYGCIPVVQLGAAKAVQARAKNQPKRVRWEVKLLASGADMVLCWVGLPLIYSLVTCWLTVVTVRYGQSSGIMLTIVAAAGAALVGWVACATGINYATHLLEEFSGMSNSDGSLWRTVRGRQVAHWAAVVASIALTGILCLFRILPGQSGLYFQPLAALALCVVIAMVVRPFLGIRSFGSVWPFTSPNFLAELFSWPHAGRPPPPTVVGDVAVGY